MDNFTEYETLLSDYTHTNVPHQISYDTIRYDTIPYDDINVRSKPRKPASS